MRHRVIFWRGDRLREFVPWLGMRSGTVYQINEDGEVWYRDDTTNDRRKAGINAENLTAHRTEREESCDDDDESED